MIRTIACSIAATFLLLTSDNVAAGNGLRSSHGPSHCQGALPAHETSLRKRPLAIANEGDTQAFVTCDFETPASGIGYAQVSLINRSPVTVTVSCTLVEGRASSDSTPQYFPRSFRLNPYPAALAFGWTAINEIGENFLAPAVSCLLRPGVEIFRVARDGS